MHLGDHKLEFLLSLLKWLTKAEVIAADLSYPSIMSTEAALADLKATVVRTIPIGNSSENRISLVNVLS